MKDHELLALAVRDLGVTEERMLKDAAGENCPGICRECHFVTEDMDSDDYGGCCAYCGARAVISVLMLAGLA
jgi:hypothetical protein